MFDSLQKDSTECAPQYTMETYCVQDLPNVKSFPGICTLTPTHYLTDYHDLLHTGLVFHLVEHR